MSGEQWRALFAGAERELTPRNQELIRHLRETPYPIPVRGSAKEALQRLERWVWRYLWFEKHKDFPVYKSPPPRAWIFTGAEAYYASGLKSEAIKVLEYLISVDEEKPLTAERMKLIRWYVEIGRIREAIRGLTALSRHVMHLGMHARLTRLQLYLAYLMDKYHRLPPTPAIQRRLHRLAASDRWTAPLLTDPELRAIERNIRGTWALLHQDTSTAKRWYQPDPDLLESQTVALRINLWLTLLYEKAPAEDLIPVIQSFSVDALSHYQRTALLERIGETYLQYMPLYAIRGSLPLLRRAFLLQGEISPSIELLRIRLFWLGQEGFPYQKELLTFCHTRRYPAAMRWQGYLLWLLIAVEEKDYRGAVIAYEEMQSFIRYRKKRLPAALPVLHFLKNLFSRRWSHQFLREAALLWREYLDKASQERFYWHHTLLPLWIEAHLSGHYVKEYKKFPPPHFTHS